MLNLLFESHCPMPVLPMRYMNGVEVVSAGADAGAAAGAAASVEGAVDDMSSKSIGLATADTGPACDGSSIGASSASATEPRASTAIAAALAKAFNFII